MSRAEIPQGEPTRRFARTRNALTRTREALRGSGIKAGSVLLATGLALNLNPSEAQASEPRIETQGIGIAYLCDMNIVYMPSTFIEKGKKYIQAGAKQKCVNDNTTPGGKIDSQNLKGTLQQEAGFLGLGWKDVGTDFDYKLASGQIEVWPQALCKNTEKHEFRILAEGTAWTVDLRHDEGKIIPGSLEISCGT